MRHIRIVMAIHKMLETKRAGHIRMLMNIRTIYFKIRMFTKQGLFRKYKQFSFVKGYGR